MPPESKPARSLKSRLMENLCECLPNCSKAMALVETGCQRELKTTEKLALKYHGRLCPFCACATGKFEAAKAVMQEAERQRNESS